MGIYGSDFFIFHMYVFMCDRLWRLFAICAKIFQEVPSIFRKVFVRL